MIKSRLLSNFKNISHGFFNSEGGYSNGIYKSLNCGRGSRDNKNNINKNLNFVAKTMKVKRTRVILMYQTHSNKVVEIKKHNYKKKIIADAMITKMRGVAISVVTADCVPIFIYDIKNNIIGCIHAGWKGAFSNIIKNTIKKIKKLGSKNKLYASVGPCIGKKNYEVDIKFYKKFVSKSRKNEIYFINKNKTKKFFNLRKFVTDKLLEFDIEVDQVDRDTYADKSNFFSYRRSSKLKQKDYGRCISAIRLI